MTKTWSLEGRIYCQELSDDPRAHDKPLIQKHEAASKEAAQAWCDAFWAATPGKCRCGARKVRATINCPKE